MPEKGTLFWHASSEVFFWLHDLSLLRLILIFSRFVFNLQVASSADVMPRGRITMTLACFTEWALLCFATSVGSVVIMLVLMFLLRLREF